MKASDVFMPSGAHRPPGAAAERFLVLDQLRGIAALVVILDHVPTLRLGELLPGRFFAVDFFFVLSGFVLAHSYGARLQQGWSPLSFMRTRLIRLYPLYLVGFAIGLATAITQTTTGAISLLPVWTVPQLFAFAGFGLLFLPQPVMAPGPLYPLNGPSWSLFYELIANFLYAVLAPFLSWRVLGAILVVGAFMVVAALYNHFGRGGPGWLWAHADAAIARVVFEFFAGVAIYRMRSIISLPKLPWWLAIAAFLAVIAVPIDPASISAWGCLVAIVLMPLLVALSASSKVTGAIAWSAGVLGALSYGVYCLHVPLFHFMYTNLGVHFGQNAWAAITVATVASAATLILNRVYDRPVRAWLSRVLPGGSTNKPPPVSANQDG
jgi:peptidoglycan/LPS O-acetylase OafA/YrhL